MENEKFAPGCMAVPDVDFRTGLGEQVGQEADDGSIGLAMLRSPFDGESQAAIMNANDGRAPRIRPYDDGKKNVPAILLYRERIHAAPLRSWLYYAPVERGNNPLLAKFLTLRFSRMRLH